jgi:hypothetical protein
MNEFIRKNGWWFGPIAFIVAIAVLIAVIAII